MASVHTDERHVRPGDQSGVLGATSRLWSSPIQGFHFDGKQGLDKLKVQDSFTYGNLAGQIRESEGRGLGRSNQYRDPQDYRCPLKFAPTTEPDPPWLGELKASRWTGKGEQRTEWRLYFGEPINYLDHVVGVTLRDSKFGRFSVRQNSDRQKQHVVQAMRYLIGIRTKRGISQAQVARAIGIDRSGVSRFEADVETSNPTMDVVLRYAHAIGAMIHMRAEPVEEFELRQVSRAGETPIRRFLVSNRIPERSFITPTEHAERGEWVVPGAGR